MKKALLTTAAIIVSFTSLLAQSKQVSTLKTPVIPVEYRGHWQKGVFSLTSFEQHDGKYVGPANETSVSYFIEENGSAKEYFIANTNSYNCRLQVLGYREGKLVLNNLDATFEFQPTSGYYTSLSCFSKTPSKKPYTSKELYPEYSVKGFFRKDETGSVVLVTQNKDGGEGLLLRRIK